MMANCSREAANEVLRQWPVHDQRQKVSYVQGKLRFF